MAALLTDGSGVVLATAGGVALAIPSLEARAGLRADASGTKSATHQADGRTGPRADAAGAKAVTEVASGAAGARAEAIGIRVASGGAEARAGALGDAAALKEAAGAAEVRAGVLGDAAALKAATATAEARAGLTGEAVPHTSADVTLSATGTAGARGEAVGTATINPADETGQGSGGPHKHDDGVPRISMRAKRDRDAAEFARQQAEEREQAEQVSAADELPEAPSIAREPPADLLSLMGAGWAAPLLVQLGMPVDLMFESAPTIDPAALAAERFAAELEADDEEAIALILEALIL